MALMSSFSLNFFIHLTGFNTMAFYCALFYVLQMNLLTSARNIRLVQFIMPMAVLYNTAFQQGMEERRLYLEVEGCMGVTQGGEGLLFTAGHSLRSWSGHRLCIRV